MRVGIQENMLPAETLKGKVRLAASLGLHGIEFWGDHLWDRVPEIETALKGSDVVATTICGGYRGHLLHADPNEREQAIADIERLLEVGGQLGVAGLVVVPRFGKPFHADAQAEEELFQAILAGLAQVAEKYRCRILLEPLNRYLNDFMNTAQRALHYIRPEYGAHIGVVLDFFHMNIEEADIAQSLKAAGPHLRHVHITDTNRLCPGEGHLDWNAARRWLEEQSYSGFAVMECKVGEPALDRLERGVEVLRRAGWL